MTDTAAVPPRVAAVLNRFPGPVQLKISPLKWSLMILGSAAFVAIGIMMLNSGNVFWGWIEIIFFGATGIASIYHIIPGNGGMMLDATGFDVHGFRGWRAAWTIVDNFSVYAVRTAAKIVVYDDLTHNDGTIVEANRFLSGRSAGLPDTYGFRADELALLMTLWRERALKQLPASP